MAKKKFENLVDESFREGYSSDPEASVEEKTTDTIPTEKMATDLSLETKKKFFEELYKTGFDKAIKVLIPTELKTLCYNIKSGSSEIINKISGRKDRSTYYLTDLHRACIEVVSHEEGMSKNDVVVAALEKYFSEDVEKMATARIAALAVKKLEKEIRS